MCASRRCIDSWFTECLRSLLSSKQAFSNRYQVEGALGSHCFLESARCVVNDASSPSAKCSSLTRGSINYAHFTDNRYLDRSSSHIHSATSACSLYTTCPVFYSPSSVMRNVKNARSHSTERGTNKYQCCSCGKSRSEKGFIICPSCNAVQAPDPDITYFEIFDQDPKFELDLKDLETKYKSLMKKLHPDLTHGKSSEEKEHYAQWSALVTTAYTELLKPVSRGTYLLKLQGIHVEEEGTVTDSDLIMEVMDIKETLQSRPDKQTLEQLNKKAIARMDKWSRAFKTALASGNNPTAVTALQRMSYFGRVCDDISRELL